MQTKKMIIVLVSMLGIFTIAVQTIFIQSAYASATVERQNAEKFKADFTYEMAQLTAAVISTPAANVDKFKAQLNFFTTRTTANLSMMLPEAQRAEFASEMAQIAKKIVDNPKLSVEKAKNDFAFDISQLTAKMTSRADKTLVAESVTPTLPKPPEPAKKSPNQPAASVAMTGVSGAGTQESNTLKAQSSPTKESKQTTGYGPTSQATLAPAPVTPDTYNKLIDDLTNISERKKPLDQRVKIDGGIRYHYATNTGYPSWSNNTSGVRLDLGMETKLSKDWSLNATLQAKKSILNYEDSVSLRASLIGKMGASKIRLGSFGYFMAEGNIYDSTFVGGRLDINASPIRYTLSYGSTDYTQNTIVATARYSDLDYNIEAGVYNYRPNDATQSNNTIVTLGGNYKFSNFGIGSMLLFASQKDSQGNSWGYVHSLYFGDLKEYRPGTYNIFVKYYNQPRYTYIAPTMNGRGGWMQGFKGWGFGFNLALMKNLVGSVEYYALSDLVTGEPGNTWWTAMTYYY